MPPTPVQPDEMVIKSREVCGAGVHRVGGVCLILFMGFITFLAGAFGVLMLPFEDLAKTGRVPFRYYAMMVGLISGGLGMIGIGQGLRLLLLFLGKE